MLRNGLDLSSVRVGILGLTFKENCPDLRNSKVFDIIKELESYGISVIVHDPRVNPIEAKEIYGIAISKWEDLTDLGALVLAVPHKEFKAKPAKDFIDKLIPKGCLIDVKSVIDPNEINREDIRFWRL